MSDVVTRRAARVLLGDAGNRFLLLRGWDPARPQERYWFTPGGGLEPGETDEAAAVRELFEETGLKLGAERLSSPLHVQTVEIPFDGVVYRQTQVFFAAQVDTWDPWPAAFDPDERRSIDQFKWWRVEDIPPQGPTTFYPKNLRELLREAVRVFPLPSNDA